MNYCSTCGANVGLQVPPGDNRPRHVCHNCHTIHYVNPRMVVGTVCLGKDGVLLCRRGIEPRLGYWTVPAGFLELGETTEAGAIRETYEEAVATVAIDQLIGIYSVPQLSQVHIFYLAHLLSPVFRAGEETLEAAMVRYEDIPWDSIAFPSVTWALQESKRSF
ncbi:MAG: NUDIX hydrolase [Cyanobacteria bacterium NC_groundwater_1444_Ag_S-0.65um_54_12]|nr:NUDIX hydrolase [Cyanobacteria bacterium NC_groundwater_1444_Ag_S-0.65um_54_12]